MKRFMLLMILPLLMSVSVWGQDKKVDLKNFKVQVDQVLPSTFPSKMLDGTDYLKVKNDSVTLSLPYFGEINSPGYNPDGMDFTEPIQNWKMTTKQKKSGECTEIDFTVKHYVNYKVHLTLWDNNSSSIDIIPENGTFISYQGTVTD